MPQRKIAFRVLIASILMLTLFVTSSPAAAFGPLGNEFVVNTTRDGNQYYPSIAADSNGNFVIIWNQGLSAGDAIYGQRFNLAGVAIGSEFLVSSFGFRPELAMAHDGDFIAVWRQNDNVNFQRYNANGSAQGSPTVVGSVSGNLEPVAHVAMDSSGNFVVAWKKSGNLIFARTYDASGVPQTSEFSVGTGIVPRVAMNPTGNFVVTWTSSSNVMARRYNASAVAQGAAFQVNTLSGGYYSSVGIDSTGTFVVAYQAPGVGVYDVYGQRYNALGVAQGSEFIINTATTGTQGNVRMAMNAAGTSVVVWADTSISGDANIFGRRYDATGAAQGDQFTVTDTSLSQDYAIPAISDNGDIVVAYAGVQTTPFGDFDVYARRFREIPPSNSTTITENEFYAAFETERAAFPSITQGIADFVAGGINMTVTLNTSETGRVNFTVSSTNGIVTIQIASISTLNGGAPSQNYIDTINRDLPALLTATLDNLVLARFGTGQNVESIIIDSSNLTLTLAAP